MVVWAEYAADGFMNNLKMIRSNRLSMSVSSENVFPFIGEKVMEFENRDLKVND